MIDYVVDLGEQLWLAYANPDDLREQDRNARMMQPAMFNQLVANVKRRGTLESLPYCAEIDGRVEIVSGHHRVRAARAAGLKRIAVLVDRSGLSRSEIAAKQLAHNSICGFDDRDTLREIARMIENPDDLLEAFLPPDILAEIEPDDLDKLLAPRVEMEWRTVALVFLPHQMDTFVALIESLAGTHDLVAAAPIDLYDRFAEALSQYQRFKRIIAAGSAVALMSEAALAAVARHRIENGEELDLDGDHWVGLDAVFGCDRIPLAAAQVVMQAIAKALQNGEVTDSNRWQVLEYWAADRLAE